MLNKLLESCLAHFQVCGIDLLKKTESYETFVMITTFCTEACPSTLDDEDETAGPATLGTPGGIAPLQEPYLCKGPQHCQHSHLSHENRRPVFSPSGEMAYLPIPCGRSSHMPTTGIKVCPNGETCKHAHN